MSFLEDRVVIAGLTVGAAARVLRDRGGYAFCVNNEVILADSGSRRSGHER